MLHLFKELKLKKKQNLRKFNFWLDGGYPLLRINWCNEEFKPIVVLVEDDCVLVSFIYKKRFFCKKKKKETKIHSCTGFRIA